MVVRKAQLSGNLFEPVPQFPIPLNEQDEDVQEVFLPVQFHISLFLLPKALLVVSWLHEHL